MKTIKYISTRLSNQLLRIALQAVHLCAPSSAICVTVNEANNKHNTVQILCIKILLVLYITYHISNHKKGEFRTWGFLSFGEDLGKNSPNR